MEWLRKKMGEENYKKISEEIISLLKTSLGSLDYVENDPLKIIPKTVFNEKNEENKLLKAQLEQYKTQLTNTSGLITDVELKTKLAQQELELKNKMKELEISYKKELESKNKEYLVSQLLSNEGCKHPDLLLSQINLENVLIQDNKIANAPTIIDPLKETYKTIFQNQVTGTPPQKGDSNIKPNKQQLIEQYNKAYQSGDVLSTMKLQRQINSIKEE